VREVLGLLLAGPSQQVPVPAPALPALRRFLRDRALDARPPAGHDVVVADGVVPGPDGDIPVRVFRADGPPGPLTVFLHGGGWTLCDLETHHEMALELARGSDGVVVSVDYRLAPEHPYPAALHDACAVVAWAAASAGELGAAGDRLVVAGDSAGGNLAAAAALWARDDSAAPRIDAQVLLYPVLDDDLDAPSYRSHGDGRFGLSTTHMTYYWDNYAPSVAQRSDPRCVPARAPSLRGLPATTIVIGALDPLRSEAEAYATRLAADGTPVELEVVELGFHGFASFASVFLDARRALDAAARAIRG
jgi:acetyl esterase